MNDKRLTLKANTEDLVQYVRRASSIRVLGTIGVDRIINWGLNPQCFARLACVRLSTPICKIREKAQMAFSCILY